ncbi:hypothetical protein CEXT_785381 [Caerostris extrusa]|uniref:Uncharacterized protein n=1 Tax=Caerostris extrusa TaxID=172846 RepID=A0AAV4NWU1_CAEEX|nr:hypothetical protein CEXT_785381 [Caerostris extrusa]
MPLVTKLDPMVCKKLMAGHGLLTILLMLITEWTSRQTNPVSNLNSASTSVNKAVYAATDLAPESPITYDVITSPDLDSKSPINYDVTTSPAKMSITAPGVYSYANVPSTYNTYATAPAFFSPSYQYVPANTNPAVFSPISYITDPSLHKTVPERVFTYVNAPASVPYRNYEPILVYASSAYL